MTEQTWPDWYAEQFDRAADGHKPQITPGISEDLQRDLELASRLAGLDFSADSRVRSSLRDRLSRDEKTPDARRGIFDPLARPAVFLRLAILALTLMSVLTLTNSPVLAAFGRLLGYGYLSQTGFIRLDQTLLLPGPLLVEGPSRYSINLVVAGQDSTRIWISGSAVQPAGLILENGAGFAPNHSEALSGGTILWFFNPLPPGQNHPILLLKDGQRIPLGLIPAAEVGLAPTAVTLPTRTPSSSPGQPCLTGNSKTQMCIQAAQIDQQGLHVLVALVPPPGAPAPNLWDWNLSLTFPGEAPIPIKTILPGEDPGAYALLFSPFPIREGNVTLSAHFGTPGEPDELTFTLPKMAPTLSPTPRVIQTPFDQAVPVHTPSKN